jgi:hypothetical protein
LYFLGSTNIGIVALNLTAMSFFFPTHDGVAIEIMVGTDRANQPILRVGKGEYKIPERILKELSEVPAFVEASQQEQVKTYLFAMLNTAN